jgi:hypothetical protein
MDVNEDFVDIAKGFIDNGVEFLVVGAYALAAHGFPRTTGDIDMFVRPTPVYQLGLPPRRIDILTSISGCRSTKRPQMPSKATSDR